jgi:uroporphyrinogen-III synthase
MRKMRVLVTRPLHDAQRTAERLAALGHEAVIDPVLVIEPVAFDPPSGADAVTVTSANVFHAAPRPLLAPFLARPLFAVGPHSAAAAAAYGFRDTLAAGGDAHSLARLLIDRLSFGARVLYLAGTERAHDLAALVRGAGIEIEMRAVYRAVPAERLQQTTLALLKAGGIDAVLHYSARSAGTFLRLVDEAGLREAAGRARHICISNAVAEPLGRAGLATEAPLRPSEDALFALFG